MIFYDESALSQLGYKHNAADIQIIHGTLKSIWLNSSTFLHNTLLEFFQ